MKKGSLLLCAAFFYQVSGTSQWVSPDTQLHYHDVCFLTTHNSYASHQHGYTYAQQRLSISEQLHMGVRGLMLDTHASKTGEIMLWHKNEWITKQLCGCKSPETFCNALRVIKEFLIQNPQEIVTIFLENYVSDGTLMDSALKKSGLADCILAPKDWNPVTNNGWPTIGWMQHHNKRLLIFNSISSTELTYNQWEHVIENQWGAVHHKQALKERSQSHPYKTHKRFLTLINYFPRLKVNFGNGYEMINTRGLDLLLHQLEAASSSFKDRFLNFISLDFVDEGDGMKRVMRLNQSRKNFP